MFTWYLLESWKISSRHSKLIFKGETLIKSTCAASLAAISFCKINVLKSLCRIINWNCCNAERKINSRNFRWHSFNLTLQQNLNLTNQYHLFHIVKFRKIAIFDKRWVTTLYSRYKWKWMPIHFNIWKRSERIDWNDISSFDSLNPLSWKRHKCIDAKSFASYN